MIEQKIEQVANLLRDFGERCRLLNEAVADVVNEAVRESNRGGWREGLELIGRIRALTEENLSWLRQADREYEALIVKGLRQVGARYLEEEARQSPGRKLMTIMKAIEDDQLRKAAKLRLQQVRARRIRAAVSSSTVSWGTRLERRHGFGRLMDERVFEVPLALELAAIDRPGLVLDAGGALDHAFIWEAVGRPAAQIVHFTQSAGASAARLDGDRFSYVFGDLRRTIFSDDTFDRIVCISTLEHVGMDNTRYGGAAEASPESALDAFRELLRLLAPRGRLMVSVPYGQERDFGWFRVFGAQDLAEMSRICEGNDFDVRYLYYDGCWFDGGPEPPVRKSEIGEAEPVNGVAVIRLVRNRE